MRQNLGAVWLWICCLVAAIATFFCALGTLLSILYLAVWVFAGTDYSLERGMAEGTPFRQTLGEYLPNATEMFGTGPAGTWLAARSQGWYHLWQVIYSYAFWRFYDEAWKGLKEKKRWQADEKRALKEAEAFVNPSKQRQAPKAAATP